MNDRSAILMIMTSELGLILKTVVGIIGGILIALGWLPASSKDAFTVDASTVAGYAITIISTFYLLEHALLKVKDDLQYAPEEPVTKTAPEAATVTPEPTPTPPAQ